MKKKWINRKALCAMAIMAMAAGLTGCKGDVEKTSLKFNATAESLTSDTKVHFTNEHWVYWDIDDDADVMSDADEKLGLATLVEMSNIHAGDYEGTDFNAVFVGSFSWGAKYFLGLYPHNDDNTCSATPGSAKSFSPVLNLSAEQPYGSDTSFANGVFPMVAWYGGNWGEDPYTPFNLDFHSLAGIVRLQFFSSSSQRTITSIEVSSGHQISGKFNVKDYYTFNPHLEGTSSSADDKKVTIDCGDGVSLNGGVKSFYLVLPALAGDTATTKHELKIKVTGSDGATNDLNLEVGVRRNGITYVQAIDLNNWESPEIGLVGNGTAARPYKIYTQKDMEYLASCFATTGTVKVNGQEVTADTYFRIMRSDIKLLPNWTGIDNFKGRMAYYAEGGTNRMPGITNCSAKPIFNSISSEGRVEGLVVRTYGALPTSISGTYSPFCTRNSGIIKDCRISDTTESNVHTPLTASGINFAGLCVTNSGTIEGCGNSASMSIDGGNVAGVVYTNNGTVKGCFAASPMKVENTSVSGTYPVGGVVYENTGTVQDCYFAARVMNSNRSWGGIVYTNTGTVKRCYIGRNTFVRITPSITAANLVGGIVNTQTAGTIDYCWADATLQGNSVGGIVSYMNGGRVVNCFCNEPTMVITGLGANSYAGGLVAQFNGGRLENSYANIRLVDGATYGGGAIGKITGSLATTTTMIRCYCYEHEATSHKFYGGIVGDGQAGTNTFSSCFVVDGSSNQDGYFNINVTPAYDTESTLTGMMTALNNTTSGTADGGTDWKSWVRTSGAHNLPYLQENSGN